MNTRSKWLVATALLGGCAMTPEADNSMQDARALYQQAAASPEVRLRAPVELQIAERSLIEADRLSRSGADAAIVAHHAYLAGQRARIAVATADYRRAEATVALSGEQRSRVLLEARNRDIESRDRQLELKTLETQQARGQLAAEMERLQTQVSELQAQQTERGLVLTLSGDLLFDSGRALLKPGGQKAVENLAQFMQKDPARGITIEGFTDATGSEELNRRLSEQRAQAVKEALVARGVDAGRIATRGYGPAFPVASNDTAVGRQLNRRVQFVLAPQPGASSGGATRAQ
jgi:outer membrane protein OmpA-like peptidoglycan-associated protein